MLRPAVAADAPFLDALARHPEVEPFMAPFRVDHRAAERLAEVDADPGRAWYVVLDADGSAAGCLQTQVTHERSRIAGLFGVMLDPAARGRGLMLAAVTEAVDGLFADGLHRIEVECYAYNTAATTLFERAGFTHEGTRRRSWLRGGTFYDGALLGLLAEDPRPGP